MNDFTAVEAGSFSPTEHAALPNSEAITTEIEAAYAKCISCPDHGRCCKGPKLAALQTISNVREYHRRLRNYRKIQMKSIFTLTEHEISNATVKEYFSHEEKDFRWTTVALIDSALVAICGERVGGEPDKLPSCPASSTEITEIMLEDRKKREEAETRCVELQEQIIEIQDKCSQKIAKVKSDYTDGYDYLKKQASDLQSEKADYLKRIDKKNTMIAVLGVAVFLLAITTACYIVWDFANSTAGLFRW